MLESAWDVLAGICNVLACICNGVTLGFFSSLKWSIGEDVLSRSRAGTMRILSKDQTLSIKIKTT